MGLFGSSTPDSGTAHRLASIERKLDAIIAHLGIRIAKDSLEDELRALVRNGQKLMAVKRHRELTGSSLSEAKAFVDSIQ
jgi:ribosomal protein L7/L12